MITATIEGDELIVNGESVVDEVYPGFCCKGFDYIIAFIFTEGEKGFGCCQNPDCPKFNGDDENTPYRGISDWSFEDFALELAERGLDKLPCPSCTWRGPQWLDENHYCDYCHHAYTPGSDNYVWIWKAVPWEWWLEWEMITEEELPDRSLLGTPLDDLLAA